MGRAAANPFDELYVTETISPEEFVSLFSPVLIDYALPLFRSGNVVVRGLQGSGKSMLLNLLKPEIRIAYSRAQQQLPIPEELQRFISAGISLRRSAAIDFSQRPMETIQESNLLVLPLYFGDFVNYWITADILRTLDTLRSSNENTIATELGISTKEEDYNNFAVEIAKDDCWFGFLAGVSDYKSLKESIDERLINYREYLFWNVSNIPANIHETKTPIAEPIAQVMEYLWKHSIVPSDLSLFVRIDEYDQLAKIKPEELGLEYRRIINKALGFRDPRVHFRIGSRTYAWQKDLFIFGTNQKLERDRDYHLVDIDELLRREENPRTWIFPVFAEDVFSRRLKFAEYDCSRVKGGLTKHVLGKSAKPEEHARTYAGKHKTKLIRPKSDWPSGWRDYLVILAEQNPLSAKLGEAWMLQKRKKQPMLTVPSDTPPWEMKSRYYWKKERLQQALMQIAADCKERMTWSGRDQVLGLSGGNILVFVSICQSIWLAWIQSRDTSESNDVPMIDSTLQDMGIRMASSSWYNKIPEQAFGDSRQNFIRKLGSLFRMELINDKSMSYPGHNGFSILVDQLQQDNEVVSFLNEAVDYGDLFSKRHTTRLSDRKPRTKYYLNPVLSPHFQIPFQHQKEPKYIDIRELFEWLQDAKAISRNAKPPPVTEKRSKTRDGSQMMLDLDIESD